MSSSRVVDTLVVPWAVRGQGFRGAIHVDRQWMPKQQWDGATVRDLMACVESRLDPKEGLVVVSLSLFGARLKPDYELPLLFPALLGPFHCVLAVAQPASAASMVEFTVKFLTGKTVVLKCHEDSTVEQVKKMLEEEEDVPPYDRRLIFAGHQLEDHATLKQYGVQYGAVMHCIQRLSGGGGGSIPFADVSNDSLLTEIAFSSKGFKWRRCGEGLNIEGHCENRECDAYRRMVIHPHWFESFNLVQEKTSCPICKTKITPVTCGFYNCEWTFQGVRSSDGMRMSSPWKSAEGYCYHRFDASETSGSIEWSSLLITAKPLRTSLPKASCPRSCSACADSLDSTEPEVVRVASCGHRFHQWCSTNLTATQRSMGVLCTCPSCGNPINDQNARLS